MHCFPRGEEKSGQESFMKILLENLSITINLLLQHCLINLSEEKKNAPAARQEEVFLRNSIIKSICFEMGPPMF